MLRKISLTIILLLVFEFQISNFKFVHAVYDPLSVPNNSFGIHILDTTEVNKAAELVNSSGGDWGYVTIPIRSNERDLDKWTKFMNDCRTKHLIPILRIASFPVEDHWMAPNEWDLIDFSNFLNDLPWPIQNRYVVVYNEPNHQGEWGGFVDPQEYARVLDRAIDIFHKRNTDFFIISAGLDSAAPNSPNSQNSYQYLQAMENRINGLFQKLDGFSSHSYGNPAMSTPPQIWSQQNIANFRFEQNLIRSFGVVNPKIFITEAGWRNDLIGDKEAERYYKIAFSNIWSDKNVVAVTPFLLTAGSGPFEGFSFTRGSFLPFAKELIKLPKTAGQPFLAERLSSNIQSSSTFQPVRPGSSKPTNTFRLEKFIQNLLIILHIN